MIFILKRGSESYIPVEYEKFNFPAGETHIRVIEDLTDCDLRIGVDFDSNDDLIDMIFLLDKYPDAQVVIPYFPYARQDREVNPSDVFTLRAITKLFKDAKEVVVYDPHSSVLEELLPHNLTVVRQWELFPVDEYAHIEAVIAPDAGAVEKTKKIVDLLNVPMYCVNKKRDTVTGKFISFEVPDIKETELLIVDDICDGGGTFLGIAEQLPGKTLHLWTTHGIYSKGIDVLLEKFKTVKCDNKVGTFND